MKKREERCTATVVSNSTKWDRCDVAPTCRVSFDASPKDSHPYCDQHASVVLSAFDAFVVDVKKAAA